MKNQFYANSLVLSLSKKTTTKKEEEAIINEANGSLWSWA